MIEKNVDIATPDGTVDCELVTPGADGSWPAVIMYADIGGLRPVFHDMAKRLAAEGYVVLVPNPFYRVGRTPVYENFKFGDEKTTQRMGELRPSVTAAGTARDAAAFVSYLCKLPQVKGKIGAAGYCMGGGMAMGAAAAEPGAIAAAVSFHGSRLASDDPDSPHKLAPKIRAQMFFGYAVEDRTMPPEAVEKLEKALDAAGVRYESETFEGARHGWCVKDHNVYNEKQAEQAWARMLKLFREALH